MSENDNPGGVYLGIFLGKDRYTAPKLTLGAPNVAGVMVHLNDLNEVDEIDGVSPLNTLLDHVATIDAAVMLKLGVTPSAATASPDGGFTPGGYSVSAQPTEGKSCAHGPMKFREGTSKAGKPYKGWFCTAPYGANQCKAEFVN